MPNYLHNKPVDMLIGPGLAAENFIDDSLGRSLDAMFAKEVTHLFAKVAARALRTCGIEVKLTYAKVEERWLIFYFQAAYDRDCIN